MSLEQLYPYKARSILQKIPPVRKGRPKYTEPIKIVQVTLEIFIYGDAQTIPQENFSKKIAIYPFLEQLVFVDGTVPLHSVLDFRRCRRLNYQRGLR